MKKKIIIGLSIFALIFFIGGIYIIVTIEKTTNKFDQLIQLHQVEILREHLLIQIKRVQTDLTLRDTQYARDTDVIVRNVRNLQHVLNTCFSCHHNEAVMKRLDELKRQTGDYEDALSRLLTIRANSARLAEEEESAFRTGETLTNMVNSMIMLTSMKLSQRTQSVLKDVSNTKTILFMLVAVGPLLASALAFIFIRGYTRPVNILLEATRKIKTGDLDSRVEGLTDEFGELAGSFNEMAVSLKAQLVRIEENEKRYRMLFEKAGDAIFIVDAEGENIGQIVNANEAAAVMHGYTTHELGGLNLIKDLDAPSAYKKAPQLINRILNGEWIKAEFEHQKKDGTVFPVEISAGLLEIGTHKYILAFDRDITERKRTEETLQRTEQIKICGEMAVGMAHEIKNPLAGIKVSIEVLLEELTLEENDREVLVKVIKEIRRLELLIKELLNFAKPPKPHFSLVDLNAILETAASFSLKNPSSAIKVLKHYDEHLPETMADPMQLQQIFMNLILNAVEAMRGGGTLMLHTYYDKSLNSLQVMISDTGEGIEDEMRERIFQPFFTTKSKGTGLGLAISKRLIEQHGGRIIAESNYPKGTIFRLNFPLILRLEEEKA